MNLTNRGFEYGGENPLLSSNRFFNNTNKSLNFGKSGTNFHMEERLEYADTPALDKTITIFKKRAHSKVEPQIGNLKII